MVALDLLQSAWYVLVGFFFAVYTILDGFDLGIGVLFPFLGKSSAERRSLLRIVGPVWDGNEVWLLAGAMVLFGAFPDVYATVFSGFYLAMFLVLLGLILRAVSLEFWTPDRPRTAWWDAGFVLGSLLPALLLGVALGNVVLGVPLTATGEFAGDFLTLLRPFPLVVGLFGFLAILLQGAAFAAVKTEGVVQERARRILRLLRNAFPVALVAIVVLTAVSVPAPYEDAATWVALAAVVVAAAFAYVAAGQGRDRAAFLWSSATVAALWAVVGAFQFPVLVRASNDPGLSLTAMNASSPETTLGVMLLVAALGIPAVIAYTTYIYRVFRGKVTAAPG